MEELHIINKFTNTNIWSMKKNRFNGFQSPTKIQFLETNDGRAVTQAHDIANPLAKKFRESLNNENTLLTSIYIMIRFTMIATHYQTYKSLLIFNTQGNKLYLYINKSLRSCTR
ncbi:hypothetical protein WN51_07127 [Melipona quadrifasciata]|uniref:Uncharacterized protein n=1 Tax=Melipona quadrifasciata TaxID=166423 RepID=A0A0N0BCF7_9HYME|nr:hypothetical protein WN51_07127 [Melipona quadrifasciata]